MEKVLNKKGFMSWWTWISVKIKSCNSNSIEEKKPARNQDFRKNPIIELFGF